jgi:erythromycin esterase-like protein
VRPALPESYESMFHNLGMERFVCDLRSEGKAKAILARPRLERAIGVIYLPQTERVSHYFEARLAEQFDAVIHIDQTTALAPLERHAQWEMGEPPETYPTGI